MKVGANETEALETFESNEMFDTNEASEFEQHSPNEYQPEETFETAENQFPVEAYSSHGGGSGVLRYLFLLTLFQTARAASFGRTDVCSIDDAPLESSDADDLLHFFVFVVTVTCMFGLWFFWTARKLKAEVLSLRDEYAQCREAEGHLRNETFQLRDQVRTLNARATDLGSRNVDL